MNQTNTCQKTLEEQLEEEFDKLEIYGRNRNSVETYLRLLKIKDENTYKHSLRVGFLSSNISGYMHLDQKALFFAGTLHDVGKLLIPPETLKKTKGFNEKDMAKMKKHPEYTYMLLRGVHEFSAEVALRHHKYQDRGYPKKLPKSAIDFSEKTQADINFYARILTIIDFYDSASSRKNDKFSPGNPRLPTPEEVKELLLNANKDQKVLIENLYKDGIFGQDSEWYR